MRAVRNPSCNPGSPKHEGSHELYNRWEIVEDVAGATFMAAGGSAPEFFTSTSSMIVWVRARYRSLTTRRYRYDGSFCCRK